MYPNGCNKNEEWKIRDENSSPEKKRLKKDNDIYKKKEELKNQEKDQDKISHEKRENKTRKKCKDCHINPVQCPF